MLKSETCESSRGFPLHSSLHPIGNSLLLPILSFWYPHFTATSTFKSLSLLTRFLTGVYSSLPFHLISYTLAGLISLNCRSHHVLLSRVIPSLVTYKTKLKHLSAAWPLSLFQAHLLLHCCTLCLQPRWMTHDPSDDPFFIFTDHLLDCFSSVLYSGNFLAYFKTPLKYSLLQGSALYCMRS